MGTSAALTSPVARSRASLLRSSRCWSLLAVQRAVPESGEPGKHAFETTASRAPSGERGPRFDDPEQKEDQHGYGQREFHEGLASAPALARPCGRAAQTLKEPMALAHRPLPSSEHEVPPGPVLLVPLLQV